MSLLLILAQHSRIVNSPSYAGDKNMPIDEEQKKILESLPPAHHTFFVAKASRKTTDQKLSHFTVYRDNAKSVMSFFIEHNKNKKYPGGGYASRVKKAYLTVDAKPKYAIKIYHQNMF